MWQEHYDEAIDWFKMALQKAQALKSLPSISKAYGNMGWNYSAVGDFENAETVFREAESTASRAGLDGERIYWLNALGNVYFDQRQYQAAEAASSRALTLARDRNNKRTITECLNTLSAIALAIERVDSAERYNQEASGIERKGCKDG